MATAASSRSSVGWRRAVLLAAIAASIAVLGGCGHSSAAFSWLQPTAAPRDWRVARLPDGRTLRYPRAWHPLRSDSGTVSAAVVGGHGRIRAYLNLTPHQGDETIANWHTFRARHLADEGATAVRQEAATTAQSFSRGKASCVVDSYRTSVTRYREIACLVARGQRTTVVVGAAEARTWRHALPTLERAINGLSA
jgi:hypothetical protein